MPKIYYNCPACDVKLINDASEVGSPDACAACGTHYRVPKGTPTMLSRWKRSIAHFCNTDRPLSQESIAGLIVLVSLPIFGLWIYFGIGDVSGRSGYSSGHSSHSSTTALPSSQRVYNWMQAKWQQAELRGNPISERDDTMIRLAANHFGITLAQAESLYLEGAMQAYRRD